MSRSISGKIGGVHSSIFSKIGNTFNFTNIISIKPLTSIKLPKSDYEALKLDWDSVGREVRVAIERFEG